MWVVTRIQRCLDDAFERAIAGLVELEAAACPRCRAVLEATGALPAHCQACGQVRNTAWQSQIEERASRALTKTKAG